MIITLLYLARQIRQSNRQAMLGAFQHTYDNMSSWCALVSESPDFSPIVLRGRESHLYQVHQTAIDEEYRKWAVESRR